MNVEKLAKVINTSHITLYRKIKAIFILTPLKVINIARLKKATEMLTKRFYKLHEMADMVGSSSKVILKEVSKTVWYKPNGLSSFQTG